jgi:predicted SprT family Zn-dependent metalloprotease
MDLGIARGEMLGLMDYHDLEGWSFDWDRAVRRRGQCNHTDRQITMSRRLTELATYEEARQTMLHEIAHALVGPTHGHDRVWLRQARAIGYTGHRTSTRQNEVPSAFVAICPGCSHEHKRFRRPRSQTACGRCCNRYAGGRFDERFALTYQRRESLVSA